MYAVIYFLLIQVMFSNVHAAQIPSWSFYGDGYSQIVETSDREEEKSLWMSCDWGENQTAFYQWKDLDPGVYKITYYLKAQDLQLGPDQVSLWNFHDGGEGTVSSYQNLTGTFNWRKIQYTVNVKSDSLTLWFRLKGPGTVWINDFSIEKSKIIFDTVVMGEPEFEKKKGKSADLISVPKKQHTINLFNFNQSERGHPFTVKNRVGEFKAHKFYNFNLSEISPANWRGFDRIEMDIFNPNDQFAFFSITLADEHSRDYWSQTNHKQNLAPGWNKVSFSLSQFVGERGSHRIMRSLNLDRLTKFYLIVDPDEKQEFESSEFLIDNVKLAAYPPPLKPAGIHAFDFTSHKAQTSNGFTKVTTQTLYQPSRGYGFVKPKFWRVEDSQYASEAQRYTIGLLSGHFRVDLPNGRYKLKLNMDKLGYWDVPFWQERNLYANGKIIHKESRPKAKNYMEDLLRFQNVEPSVHDNPYDLYLSKAFSEIEKTVEVNDGILDLSFEGDASAISLNTLLIWNIDYEAAANKYLSAINERNKLEFEWISKPIVASGPQKKSLSKINVINPRPDLSPSKFYPAIKTSLMFKGGTGETLNQLLQIENTQSVLTWEVSPLLNSKGEKIDPLNLQFFEVGNQFSSPDLNHETYGLNGKFLKKLSAFKIAPNKNPSQFLWLQLKLKEKIPVGMYKGEIHFTHGKLKSTYPITVEVLNYELPKVDIPVGFIGLDPLPSSYFPGTEYLELRKKYRYLALEHLSEAGFTTYTGLPDVNIKQKGKDFEFDTNELDELFEKSKQFNIGATVYSYGGQFPKQIVGMSNNVVLTKKFEALLNKKNWPKIVYTFSDEAGGYSDQIKNDIEKAQKLKSQFPFLALGGFGSTKDRGAEQLNSTFDYGFFSHIGQRDIKNFHSKNKSWGLYNLSAGNYDDPRMSFGPMLFSARKAGLSQYLEWSSAGFNNYPYYELDGREADIVNFYPTLDGRIYPSIRFALATEGLQFYRKMVLLENLIKTYKSSGKSYGSAKAWLDSYRGKYSFTSTDDLKDFKQLNFYQMNAELTQQLQLLVAQKLELLSTR